MYVWLHYNVIMTVRVICWICTKNNVAFPHISPNEHSMLAHRLRRRLSIKFTLEKRNCRKVVCYKCRLIYKENDVMLLSVDGRKYGLNERRAWLTSLTLRIFLLYSASTCGVLGWLSKNKTKTHTAARFIQFWEIQIYLFVLQDRYIW